MSERGKIAGVHHVSFTVSDMERSLVFYRDGLDFEVVNDRTIRGPFPETVTALQGVHMRVIHLHGHGQGLELIQFYSPPGKTSVPYVCDVGSAHLCYIVDDIEAMVRRLEPCGARFLSTPMTVEGGPNAGNRMVYFVDPDGILMELTQPAR